MRDAEAESPSGPPGVRIASCQVDCPRFFMSPRFHLLAKQGSVYLSVVPVLCRLRQEDHHRS